MIMSHKIKVVTTLLLLALAISGYKFLPQLFETRASIATSSDGAAEGHSEADLQGISEGGPQRTPAQETTDSNSGAASSDLESGQPVEIDGQMINPGWDLTAKLIEKQYGWGNHHKSALERRYLKWRSDSGPTDVIPYSSFLSEPEVTIGEFETRHADSIAEQYNWRIRDLLSNVEPIMEDALADYFSGQKYIKYRADGQPPPEPRPTDGSKYWLDGRFERGGWVCLLQFRSAEYPTLNETLQAIEALRNERNEAVSSYLAGLK